MRKVLVRSSLLAVVSVCLVAQSTMAQAVSEELADLERRFAGARADAVHLLAPRAFGDAADQLRDAQQRVARGDDVGAARERLARAETAIAAAETLADGVRSSFLETLRARAEAVSREAAGRAESAWEIAEREFERAGRDAERGNLEDARELAARAVELYRRAGEAARSDLLLGAAIDARQAALSAGGSELAPETFIRGEEALSRGRDGLAAGSDNEVGRQGEQAADAFRRAEWLAVLADSVLSREISLERFVNAHERDLATLAEAAGVAPPDLRAGGRTIDEIDRAIRGLLAQNAELESSLRSERATSQQLSGQVSSLEAALNDAERRYTESRSELLDRQRRDDRLRETSALFTEDEGEVFLNGDDLVLRLHGLTFESGSDEVDESMAPLLTKVERVLLDFPDAMIRIEGHTDSQGNPDRNRALSQTRAIAIREYLLSRVPISSSRMEATGHGEDLPIARNDTEAGRARNRRIEIILTLQS